jgi:hypothetical protein
MVQTPIIGKAFWSFEIEIWDLFGIWDLCFGFSMPVWFRVRWVRGL